MQAECKTPLQADSLERLFDHLPEVVYSAIFDDPIRFTVLARPFEALTGRTVDDVQSGAVSWMDLVHEKDRAILREAYEPAQQGEPMSVEYRLCTSDGSVREVLDRAVPVRDAAGEVVGLDGMILDVTLRRQTERALERTQMLQSMGRLAAGIVHEINTPIQFIGDNMRFLADSFAQVLELIRSYQQFKEKVRQGLAGPQDGEQMDQAEAKAELDFLSGEIPSAIEQTLEGVNRVSTIVSAMRDFSHIDERRMAPADINRALRSTLIVVHNALKYVAHVETDFDPNLPLVMCCVDDLNQVFVNLLVNAAHAIGDVIDRGRGELGTITVRTRREGPDVVIAISDTGTGIPEEVRRRMYEPFFTTKGGDKGTGQGLLFVRTIVCDKHKGRLDCDTEVGKGTTFTMTIPIEGAQPRRK